jgi:archaellum component FlaD/FlaE
MTGSDRDEKEAAGKEPSKEKEDDSDNDSDYEEDDEEEEEANDDTDVDTDEASSATEVTTASVEKEASDPPHCLVFGYPSFKVWRCCFYGLMTYQVAISHFGPCTFQR